MRNVKADLGFLYLGAAIGVLAFCGGAFLAGGCERLRGLRPIVDQLPGLLTNSVPTRPPGTNEPARPPVEPDEVEPQVVGAQGGDCWVREFGAYRTWVSVTPKGVIYAVADDMSGRNFRLCRVAGKKVQDIDIAVDPAGIGPAEILTPRVCAVGESALVCCQYFTSCQLDRCGQGVWRVGPTDASATWVARYQAGRSGWNRCDLVPFGGGAALAEQDERTARAIERGRIAVAAPVVAAPVAPAGTQMRETWEVELTDKAAFLRAVVEGCGGAPEIPLEWVNVDLGSVRRMVIASKGAIKYPGVTSRRVTQAARG